ncbi:hypothetical protein E2562_037790 [Oryza meyeriana var. granulata]|uniref:Peptidase A1 domain-containing protein n=1 Tax=Oryza meyeriana var. granulata TaxID=110450 RepID=A0A6G1E905_9ORYZ|nr:hypothetical protein E2562_037790 [Oryza meyeriana var. granulata]
MLISILTIWFCPYIISPVTADDSNCANTWEDNPAPQLNDSSATVRFTVLHREHPCFLASTVPADHFSPSTLSTRHTRVRRLSAGCFSSCPEDGGHMGGSIFANGVPWDQYSYVTQIQLGTPATTYNMLVDTGSSLSWIRCKQCINECPGPVFDPAASSTYNVVYCRSSLCNVVPSATMTPSTCWMPFEKCSYNQTYEDGSRSVGVVSSDRLTYGRTSVDLVFGCSNRFEGLGGHYSGIIGVSANTLSFFTQLTVGHRYKAMAYCFPHPSKVGFLQFGQYDRQQDGMSFTPLSIDGNNYHVHLTDIIVVFSSVDIGLGMGGNQTMRCFFDTGTAYSVLPRHLFARLSDAVEERIEGFYRVGTSTGQTCFQPDLQFDEEDSYMPTMKFVLQGGATLILTEEDLYIEEVPGKLYCLAFKENNSGDVVVGSKFLMALQIVVDLENSTMGFRDRRGCS